MALGQPAPARWLPAPLHLLPLLFGMSHFSVWEKFSLAYGMMRLAVRQNIAIGDAEPTAARWLREKQPERVIHLFWQPVIESAPGVNWVVEFRLWEGSC